MCDMFVSQRSTPEFCVSTPAPAVAGLVVCSGTIEFSAANAIRHGDNKISSLVAEPAAAGLLLQDSNTASSGVAGAGGAGGDVQMGGGAQGGGVGKGKGEGSVRPWRKRVPRWAAVLRVNQVLVWRCSQVRAWLHTDPASNLSRLGLFPYHRMHELHAEAKKKRTGEPRTTPQAAERAAVTTG